jgi:phosphate uptake regulator
MDEFNFIGVSENTQKYLAEQIEKFTSSSNKLSEVEEIAKSKFGKNLSELTADMMTATRDLIESLNKAESEAILESDKESIREAIKNLDPLNRFYRDISYSVFEAADDCGVKNSDVDRIISAGI